MFNSSSKVKSRQEILKPINLKKTLAKIEALWTPNIISHLDNNHIYLTKIKGDYIWHKHSEYDELFLVLDGALRLDFRDKSISIGPGELLVVPKNTEHKPFSENGCSLLIIEDERTVCSQTSRFKPSQRSFQ